MTPFFVHERRTLWDIWTDGYWFLWAIPFKQLKGCRWIILTGTAQHSDGIHLLLSFLAFTEPTTHVVFAVCYLDVDFFILRWFFLAELEHAFIWLLLNLGRCMLALCRLTDLLRLTKSWSCCFIITILSHTHSPFSTLSLLVVGGQRLSLFSWWWTVEWWTWLLVWGWWIWCVDSA